MVVASVKISTVRVAVVVFAIAVLVAVALWPRGRIVVQAAASPKNAGISTNEKRIQFLESYGWKVEENPIEVVEVTIPQKFNAVYNNYNAIQKKQGFDLAKYKGKRVKRWTYKITNYSDTTEEVHANLLIYNNIVIGGDVSTVSLSGFMQGLSKNTSQETETSATPQNADITQGIFTVTTVK